MNERRYSPEEKKVSLSTETIKNLAGYDVSLSSLLNLDGEQLFYLYTLLADDKAKMDKANHPDDFHARVMNADILEAIDFYGKRFWR